MPGDQDLYKYNNKVLRILLYIDMLRNSIFIEGAVANGEIKVMQFAVSTWRNLI